MISEHFSKYTSCLTKQASNTLRRMPSSCQNTKRWRAALPSSPTGSKSWFTDRILWFFSWEILGRAIVVFYCMTLIFCCHCILLLDWWPAVSFDTGILPGHSSAFSLHIIWLINLAAGFRRVSKYDLYIYCLPFETSFEWCLWNWGSSLPFMTAFFAFLEGIMCLFWKIPLGLPRVATLEMLPTFYVYVATVWESFMTVRFLRTGANAFACRTSQVFEMSFIFLPVCTWSALADCVVASLFQVLLYQHILTCIVYCGFFSPRYYYFEL